MGGRGRRRLARGLVLLGMPTALLGALVGCRGGDPATRVEPPLRLSEYRLFVGDPAAQRPAEDVLLYELNSPLFSDHADKHRFVRLPPGGEIGYRTDDTLEMPVGTVIAKTFSYRRQDGGRHLLETRILRRLESGWEALPYVWDEAQREARLEIIGGVRPARVPLPGGEWIEHAYRIPNRNQCKGCHRRRGDELLPIGPTAAQLNREVEFADGAENVLDRWRRLGVLAGAPPAAEAPRAAVWNDPASGTLDERARIWLDVNCAHCHNPEGPARTSSLDLRAGHRDRPALGVMKTPVAAGRGSGDRLYSIVPGAPDESILVYRLESLDPGAMMPELGRSLVDHEAVRLIRDWIVAMAASDVPGSEVPAAASRSAGP
ncbi:MAG: hypothetical protein DWQ36_17175 [Acidobacteria bacterium]|nr:MAG: hypothetical protein DWQ30_05270 [Acidobacteriota bacterium]REK04581.1 MAG: hypothetical protein DWQ36_17175 [Acidobacteriota bacterium]